MNEYTPLLQEYVDVEYAKIGISVNAICPGTKHYKMRNLLPEEIISDEEAGKIIINLASGSSVNRTKSRTRSSNSACARYI